MLTPKITIFTLLTAALTAGAQFAPPMTPTPGPGQIDALLQAQSSAFSDWDFGVNDRTRYEDKEDAGTTHAGSNYDFSAKSPTDNSNYYWLSRLMPRVGYADDWFSAVVEARSSYTFGDDRYTTTAPGKNLAEDDGPFELQMAYLQVGNLKKFPLTLRVGRQELTYGDGRLLGNALWLNIPHTFDAIKARFQDDFFGVDVFAARLVYVDRDHFEQGNHNDTLSGAYFDFPGVLPTNVTELYAIARNVSRSIVGDNWSQVPAPFRFTSPEDLYTFGYRTKTKPGALGPWDYGLEVMGQLGDRTAVFPATTVAVAKAAPRLDQHAWAMVAQGSYTWKGIPWTPKLALIISAASGDKNPTDKDSGTFQNLLPSNHGLYGMMDLSSLQNIEDYRLSFTAKPAKTVSLGFDLHQQYLITTHDYWYTVAGVPRSTPASAVNSGKGFGINPAYSSDLGQEGDLVGGWTPYKGICLEAGLGHFFRGEYVKESFRAVGSHDADYFYVQSTLNF